MDDPIRIQLQTKKEILKIKSGQIDVVFTDFAKAFDLVGHTILLTKLYKYGVCGSLLEWCRDYLTDHQQRVVVKGEVSD